MRYLAEEASAARFRTRKKPSTSPRASWIRPAKRYVENFRRSLNRSRIIGSTVVMGAMRSSTEPKAVLTIPDIRQYPVPVRSISLSSSITGLFVMKKTVMVKYTALSITITIIGVPLPLPAGIVTIIQV